MSLSAQVVVERHPTVEPSVGYTEIVHTIHFRSTTDPPPVAWGGSPESNKTTVSRIGQQWLTACESITPMLGGKVEGRRIPEKILVGLLGLRDRPR